jgi:uncharacterized protein
MKNIRHRIEAGFAQFATQICRHRFKTLGIMLLLIAGLFSQLPKITIDTSTEGFLHEKDPALLAYNAFRDQFGRDEVIIIALKPKRVFDPDFLETLKRMHRDLEDNVPYVDDITSLINARNTRGEENELIVEDLMEHWPETEADLAVISDRAMANPMYRNMLLSEDGTFTTIVIQSYSQSFEGTETDILDAFETTMETVPSTTTKKYLTDAENSEFVTAVRKVIADYQTGEFEIYLAGSPVFTNDIKRSMMSDMRKFMGLAILTVSIALYVMFRRLSGVLLPLTIVILSLLSTISLMAVTHTAIKVPTQILPSFILAVGVGTSVHILAIFFFRLRKKGDKNEAIAYAMGHSGLPIVMTNMTTAAGLMSFSTAEVAPIADLGIFAGIGVLIAFIYTIVLLPALLAVIPLSSKKTESLRKTNRIMDRFLGAVSRFSTTHPKKILLVTALIIVSSAVITTRIQFSHHPLHWFQPDNPIRVATEKIDSEMNGSLSLEIILDTEKQNGLYEPELLQRIDAACGDLEQFRSGDVFVGKVWSVTTILKEINQALNENRPEAYAVPLNRDLVAQEFLLFENSGSDDLEDFVDTQFSKTRMVVKLPFEDAVKYNDFTAMVREYMESRFSDVRYQITGMIALLAQVINNSIISMARSYVIALIVITFLMVVLIGRIRIGLLSMIPNLAPILLTMSVIEVFGFPMDLFTMLVASIGIGLAVDDTIHFMHNFRRYYELTGDPAVAIAETLHTTGRAMLVTTVVLALGFFIFTFAEMQNLIRFGFLTGFTITTALAADYLVAPALMMVFNPKKTENTSLVTAKP